MSELAPRFCDLRLLPPESGPHVTSSLVCSLVAKPQRAHNLMRFSEDRRLSVPSWVPASSTAIPCRLSGGAQGSPLTTPWAGAVTADGGRRGRLNLLQSLHCVWTQFWVDLTGGPGDRAGVSKCEWRSVPRGQVRTYRRSSGDLGQGCCWCLCVTSVREWLCGNQSWKFQGWERTISGVS